MLLRKGSDADGREKERSFLTCTGGRRSASDIELRSEQGQGEGIHPRASTPAPGLLPPESQKSCVKKGPNVSFKKLVMKLGICIPLKWRKNMHKNRGSGCLVPCATPAHPKAQPMTAFRGKQHKARLSEYSREDSRSCKVVATANRVYKRCRYPLRQDPALW
jgi:hypothetical protein